MKAAPTLDGRVRIDLESELDVQVMRAIFSDARMLEDSLAERVSDGMDDSLTEDWIDFVKPDLEETFSGQLLLVVETLADAVPGEPVFVEKEQAESWYGALNQARLALEERFSFGDEELEGMETERRAGGIRSHFYQVLQGLIFEFLMKG